MDTILSLIVYGQFWPSDSFHLRLADPEIEGAFIMCMELLTASHVHAVPRLPSLRRMQSRALWRMDHTIALMAEGTLLMQCVAIDAREERIAAGDISGRIHMWNAFGPAVAAAAGANSGSVNDQSGQAGRKKDVRDANLPKETLHWHAAAVSSLTFSADGTYLLSGGREAVLVSSLHEALQALKALFRTSHGLHRARMSVYHASGVPERMSPFNNRM